jgi:aspartyl protease
MQQTSINVQNQRLTLGFVVLLVGIAGALCPGTSLVGLTDPAVLQSSAGSEVAFDLYNDNLLIVKATVGNIRDVMMILDTGTNPTVISKKIVNRRKLLGTTERLQTLAGSIQSRNVILPNVEVGVLHVDSIRVIAQDLNSVERSLEISLGGIVGFDFLSTGRFTIDYQKKKIVFGPMPASENVVPFVAMATSLTVNAVIDGLQVRLLLGSGTSGLRVFRIRLGARPGQDRS